MSKSGAQFGCLQHKQEQNLLQYLESTEYDMNVWQIFLQKTQAAT